MGYKKKGLFKHVYVKQQNIERFILVCRQLSDMLNNSSELHVFLSENSKVKLFHIFYLIYACRRLFW